MNSSKSITAQFAALPSTIWQLTAGEQYFDTSPGFGLDGTLYLAFPDGKIKAIKPNGDALWSFDTSKSPGGEAAAVAADGTIYFGMTGTRGGGSDGSLIAMNPDGTKKWEFPAGNRVTTSPALALDGTVYIGSIITTFTPCVQTGR
jgi:outer membrane protein assembly factor BamB